MIIILVSNIPSKVSPFSGGNDAVNLEDNSVYIEDCQDPCPENCRDIKWNTNSDDPIFKKMASKLEDPAYPGFTGIECNGTYDVRFLRDIPLKPLCTSFK